MPVAVAFVQRYVGQIMMMTSYDGVVWSSPVYTGLAQGYGGLSPTPAPALVSEPESGLMYIEYLGEPNAQIAASSSPLPTPTKWSYLDLDLDVYDYSPSLGVFGGRLYSAYNDSAAQLGLFVRDSSDGVTWSPGRPVASPTGNQQTSWSSPSIVTFKNTLYMAYLASNTNGHVLICSSTDGWIWTEPLAVGAGSAAPALAVFNERLFVSYSAADGIFVRSSADGIEWSSKAPVNQMSYSSPVMAAYGSLLCLAFVAANERGAILVCTSQDGITWSKSTLLNEGQIGYYGNYLFPGDRWVWAAPLAIVSWPVGCSPTAVAKQVVHRVALRWQHAAKGSVATRPDANYAGFRTKTTK